MQNTLKRKKRDRDIINNVMHFFGAALLFLPQLVSHRFFLRLKRNISSMAKNILEKNGSVAVPHSDPLFSFVSDEAKLQGIDIEGLYIKYSDKMPFVADVYALDESKVILSLVFNKNGEYEDNRMVKSILGHEFAHVCNNDLQRYDLANNVSNYYSALGLVTLPIYGSLSVSLSLFAVGIGLKLLQQVNSRAQEYIADLESVNKTGDPEAMLEVLTIFDNNEFGFDYFPEQNKGVMASHPLTTDRMDFIKETFDLPIYDKSRLIS